MRLHRRLGFFQADEHKGTKRKKEIYQVLRLSSYSVVTFVFKKEYGITYNPKLACAGLTSIIGTRMTGICGRNGLEISAS